MKKLLCAIALAIFIGGPRLAFADSIELASDTVVSQDTNYDFPASGYSNLTFTLTYSTTPPAAFTFTDGRPSTASITVNDYTALIPRKSTFTIDVMSASTTTLRSTGVILNGDKYYGGPGGAWTPVITATGNATALAAAIDASADWDAVAVSTVVYATATIAGTQSNAWVLTTNSTTSFRLNHSNPASTFPIGGQGRARLVVKGVTFDIQDSTAVTNSSTTAKNISDTLMANATISALFTSTWSAAAVITATSTTNGANAYTLFTSTPNGLRLNGSATAASDTFLNGSVSKIDLSGNTIDATHRANTGFAVWLGTAGYTTPGGLANGTTYYLIKVTKGQFKLATTKANATAGTAIDITSQAGGGTFTLNPVVMPATTGFGLQWQVSNDNTNWANFTTTSGNISISSITINSTTSAGTAGNNLGDLGYRYLRLKYTAPAQGGTNIQATGSGRR